MLQQPTLIFYEHPFQTLSAIFAVSLCLIFPCALSLTLLVAKDSTIQYYEMYEPTIYVHSDTPEDKVNQLSETVKKFSGVASIEERSPSDAYTDLLSEISLTEQKQLDLEASAFPKSLRIKLEPSPSGYTSTFSKISALTKDPIVIDVDVPNAKALALLNTTHYLAIGALLFALVSIIVSYATFEFLLRNFLKIEEPQNKLLYAFGAPPDAISNPYIKRGAILGAGATLVVGLIFSILLAVWFNKAPLFLGGATKLSFYFYPLLTISVCTPFLLGFLAGYNVSRSALGFAIDTNLKLGGKPGNAAKFNR